MHALKKVLRTQIPLRIGAWPMRKSHLFLIYFASDPICLAVKGCCQKERKKSREERRRKREREME